MAQQSSEDDGTQRAMQQQGQGTTKTRVKFTKVSYMCLEGKQTFLPSPLSGGLSICLRSNSFTCWKSSDPPGCPSLSSCTCCPNPSWLVCSLRVMGVMNQSCRIIIKLLFLLGVDVEADGLETRPWGRVAGAKSGSVRGGSSVAGC